jgi:hypothetical protein
MKYYLNHHEAVQATLKNAMLGIGRDSRWYKLGDWIACAFIAGTIGMLAHYIFIAV